MPLIPFPDVPKSPGVPAVPRSPKFPPKVQAAIGIVQGALWRVVQTSSQWGVYDSAGRALADPSLISGVIGRALGSLGVTAELSTDSVEYSKETRVSDFPIERGSFASYNKAELSSTPVVTLCLSGKSSDRKKFLDAISAACLSTDLYTVVTPEVSYAGYSIERYSYQRRQSKGCTLLYVELCLREIRQVSAIYAQSGRNLINAPKNAGATPTAAAGKVQAATPRVSVLKSIANKLPSLAQTAGDLIQKVTQ